MFKINNKKERQYAIPAEALEGSKIKPGSVVKMHEFDGGWQYYRILSIIELEEDTVANVVRAFMPLTIPERIFLLIRAFARVVVIE